MNSPDNEIEERAKNLRRLAMTDPEQVELDDVAEVLSTPVVPPDVHGAALVALMNVARVRDDIAEEFLEDLRVLLGRPSLDSALVLRCLRQLATNDPVAVLELREEITDRVSTEDTAVTQAATGCCVELAATEPTAFVDLVPTLAALLESENETIRTNAVYVLSQVAHEYPEEVKPVVPQLIDGIEARADTYQANALSALGAVVSSYPATGAQVTDSVAAIAASDAPTKVRANAVGLLGDVALEHPAEIEGHVSLLVDCLHSDDEFLAGNAAASILHLSVENADTVEKAIPALLESVDDPSPIVRRNACKALGHLEATIALESLKSTAESDPDEAVRSVARRAVEQLT